MIEIVLKSLLFFLLVGILFYLCRVFYLIFRDYLIPQQHSKTECKIRRQSIPEDIVLRARNSIIRVNNGEVKMEGLGNAADPHEEGNSISKYRKTLTEPKLLSIIKEVKELSYYE